jgi:ribokinase
MYKDIDVLVLGSMNMDIIIESDRNPYPGETIRGNNFFMSAGGKGNNQAVTIGRLGGNVAFLGCVGDDDYGKRLVTNLKMNNVKDCGVHLAKDVGTGLAMINIFNGQNAIILYEGANARCTEDYLTNVEELIKRSKILLMQLEIPLATVEFAAKKAKENSTTVVLNPAPMIMFNKKLYEYVDIIIPNELEAKAIIDMKSEVEISKEVLIEELLNNGIKNVIITLGSDGVIYNIGNKICFEGAYKVQAIDTTGAGDAFIGGFCYGLSKDWSIEKAVQFGNRVAAVKVTKLGAQTALPTLLEVNKFFENF